MITPSTCWIMLSHKCNNRCSWCYNSLTSENMKEVESVQYIDEKKCIQILETLSNVGIKRCIIIGGEPTLHPKLTNIISHAHNLGMYTILVTNGRKLKDPLFCNKLKEVGLNTVTVSMHGWNTSTYEGDGQNPLHFNEAIDGYRTSNEVGLQTGMVIVLGKHTFGNEDAILNFLHAEKVNQLGFNIAAPAISNNAVTTDFSLDLEEFREHILNIFYKATKAGIHPSFQLGLPFCLFSEDELNQLLNKNSIKQGCHILHGSGIVINPDGSPAICTHLSGIPISFEYNNNVFTSENYFLEFWNSNTLVNLRKQACVYRMEECIGCQYWNQCGGGCMIQWTGRDPDSFKKRLFYNKQM